MKRKDSMNTAFLSLGGNLGDRLENIEAALRLIEEVAGKVVKASCIYETEAWGSASEKKYLNRVIKLETHLSATRLLGAILKIEGRLGRKRTGSRYADRSMDIDILLFNSEIIAGKILQIPHPRLHLRKFILVPLSEIEKNLVHPLLKKTMGALLSESKDRLKVEAYEEPVLPRYICIEGNIGSGKSTLAKALASKLKARYVPEKFEENDLLPLFYSDRALYAFTLEYSFLIGRFQQLKDCFRVPASTVVSDFSFYKSLWFAKSNLPANEYKLFKKHFLALLAQLPEPDLLIYVETDLKNLKQNIKKRGRPYEQKIPDAYLRSIDKKYRAGLQQLSFKQLFISVEKYHPGLERDSIRTIQNYVKENFGRQGQKSYI